MLSKNSSQWQGWEFAHFSSLIGSIAQISQIKWATVRLWKVLNSVYQDKQAVELSRKSANFSFFVVKGLRLQGFKWCGRFFVETTQPFGAITAVSNYDIVGNTVCTLAIPNELVHRQIDDVPTVAPVNTSWCEEFTKEYSEISEALNIELAPDCPLTL